MLSCQSTQAAVHTSSRVRANARAVQLGGGHRWLACRALCVWVCLCVYVCVCGCVCLCPLLTAPLTLIPAPMLWNWNSCRPDVRLFIL